MAWKKDSPTPSNPLCNQGVSHGVLIALEDWRSILFVHLCTWCLSSQWLVQSVPFVVVAASIVCDMAQLGNEVQAQVPCDIGQVAPQVMHDELGILRCSIPCSSALFLQVTVNDSVRTGVYWMWGTMLGLLIIQVTSYSSLEMAYGWITAP